MTQARTDTGADWLGHRVFGRCPADVLATRPDVVEIDDPDFGHLYLAVSYAASNQVYRDPRWSRTASRDSSAHRMNGLMIAHACPMLEGPEHKRARRLLAPSLASAQVERLCPTVTEFVEDMVDAMRRDGPPADLVRHIARPLPARVVAAVFGLDDPDVDGLARCAETILSVEECDAADVAAAMHTIVDVATTLWHRHGGAHDPTSFTGSLLAAVGSGPTTMKELTSRVGDVIVGACENSKVFLQTGLIGLLTTHGLGMFAEKPELIPDAVEELLRLRPPGMMGLPRTALVDTEIMGHAIPAGATVIPMVTTANLDPTVYDDPQVFAVPGEPRKHMTFGAGRHYCPGAAMARLEMRVVIEVLARRLPTLRLAVPEDRLPRRAGHMIDGYREVPLAW